MLNSVVAAQQGHDFISRGWEVKTEGNPLTHTILRGAVNKHGNTLPNYHYEDLQLLLDVYKRQVLCPLRIPGKRRLLWKCGSSCHHIPGY